MSKPAKSTKKTPAQDPPLEELEIGSAIYLTRLTTKFNNRKSWQRPDERMVQAVIPGTIHKIMVKEGAEVNLGTPLLILEAMKMRNKVLSPVQGVIRKIHVAEGEKVRKERLLLEIK
ncbi:MAG: acetyl-CoA carboxylase biotin carboxyl carrier protein subunit [Bacteroidales bacterium]|nr:acetyl-CoA carboxylase biotin carboxyl carrier protein subunit [Bacteroidales bacterium]